MFGFLPESQTLPRVHISLVKSSQLANKPRRCLWGTCSLQEGRIKWIRLCSYACAPKKKRERARKERKTTFLLLLQLFDSTLNGFPTDTHLMIVFSTPSWLHTGSDFWALMEHFHITQAPALKSNLISSHSHTIKVTLQSLKSFCSF